MSGRFRRFSPTVVAAGLAVLAGWQVWQAAAIPVKAVTAQFLLARAWFEASSGEQRPQPWPWADTWPAGRLSVPHLDVDMIALAGATGRTLAFAPARLDLGGRPGPADPIVLFGHRDTHFRFLADLQTGDRISWHAPGAVPRLFQVTETAVLHTDALAVPLGGAAPVMLLVTCYPFGAVVPDTPLRYAVLLTEPGADTVAR